MSCIDPLEMDVLDFPPQRLGVMGKNINTGPYGKSPAFGFFGWVLYYFLWRGYKCGGQRGND
jgi:hypothetical protein